MSLVMPGIHHAKTISAILMHPKTNQKQHLYTYMRNIEKAAWTAPVGIPPSMLPMARTTMVKTLDSWFVASQAKWFE